MRELATLLIKILPFGILADQNLNYLTNREGKVKGGSGLLHQEDIQVLPALPSGDRASHGIYPLQVEAVLGRTAFRNGGFGGLLLGKVQKIGVYPWEM